MNTKVLEIFSTLFIATMLIGNVSASFLTGPAPNSGDGIPDGSGMDSQIENGDPEVESPGPAPNAGDGISDGSGF